MAKVPEADGEIGRGCEGRAVDLKLIDTARVRRLPGLLTRRRWVVKDLAQFWYSTTKLPVTDEQRLAWLARYAGRRGLGAGRDGDRLRRSIERKAGAIGRHDAQLREKQPTRNVSIPVDPGGAALCPLSRYSGRGLG